MENSNCILSDCVILNDVYTYVSPAWGTTSWLDHCVSTEDAHNAISSIEILHDFVSSDHLPLCVTLSLDLDKVNVTDESTVKPKPCWDKASKEELDKYFHESNELFKNIDIGIAVCTDSNCNCNTHYRCIDRLYYDIVASLHQASNKLCKTSKVFHKVVPG